MSLQAKFRTVEKSQIGSGCKPNHSSLAREAKVIPKEEEISSISIKVIASDARICGSNSIGLDARIAAPLLSDPHDQKGVIAQKLALPLGEVGFSLVPQDFSLDPLILGDFHPEVPEEKMLYHPGFWGIMGVPLGVITADNVPECGVNLLWEARLLAAPVVALPRGI